MSKSEINGILKMPSSFSTCLVPSGHYLPKKRGGQTFFAPFSLRVRPKEAPSSSPLKINASGSSGPTVIAAGSYFAALKIVA